MKRCHINMWIICGICLCLTGVVFAQKTNPALKQTGLISMNGVNQ